MFEDDYELRTLDQLASFIEKNNHLPNIPSADAMAEKGVSVAHISGRLLEKIEELTLYTLQQHEKIEKLTLSNLQQHETITQLGDRIQSLESPALVTD